MEITVLLSGKLWLEGYGRGRQKNGDGTFRVSVTSGNTVRQVMRALGVPPSRVAMTMINGRTCNASAEVRSGDRVILIPPDVAALWGALHRQSLGTGIGSDC